MPLRDKNWIVSKPALACHRVRQPSFHCSAEAGHDFFPSGHCQHASKPCTPPRRRYARQFVQDLVAVPRIARSRSSVPCRENTRPPAQTIHFKTRIICHDQYIRAQPPCRRPRFDARILLKGRPVLHWLRQVRMHRQILHMPPLAQKGAELLRLVSIVGGNHHSSPFAHHAVRSRPAGGKIPVFFFNQ